MADERVQPSLAFQQLAKRRAHPAAEPSPGRDHLYAFKYHGKPASVDPDKPATVFQAPPPDSATIWAAHPTRRGSGKTAAEHRFTATETPAKEYEVALIWDAVAQTWLLEPLDSHLTFKLDRSSKPPPPKTPAVPTEDELHAHAKSFFSSAAPNPFSSFPFSYSVTAQSSSVASGDRPEPEKGTEEEADSRPQTPPRPVSAGSLASLLNPLSASSPSHHPATFSPVNVACGSASAERKPNPSSSSPKAPPRRAPPPSASSPSRLAPAERVALRTEVEDFGEIRPASSSSLGASAGRQKPVSPSSARDGPPPASSPRPPPPHPSYGSKVPASYAARQAAAAAAAEQQKRLERELKAMDSSPSSSSSSSSSSEDDSDGQDEWQPVTIAPGGNRRQQEEEEEDDDDGFGAGRTQRPRKRSRGGAAAVVNVHAGGAAAATPATAPAPAPARTRQTRSGQAELVRPQSPVQAPVDHRPPTVVRPDLIRAATTTTTTTTTATSTIRRVAPNIDSDSESAESDDEDASSAEDGDEGSGSASASRKMTTAHRAGARSSSRPDRSSATGAVRSPARVTSLLSQQVNAQMARIRSSSSAAAATPPSTKAADHYPRIMTAAAVQQQQQQQHARAAMAAMTTTPTTGATVNQQQQRQAQEAPPSLRHHKPRPSLPPPRNSDEARQLAEREADIPDSSEED